MRLATGLNLTVACCPIALILAVGFANAAPVQCTSDAYEPDNACVASPVVIQGSQVQSRSFCDGNSDWLKFNACAGRSYVIQTSGLGSSADSVLEVYASDCTTLLASDDNSGGGLASRIAWTAPSDGVFHVRAFQADGSSGDDRDYDLSVTGDTSACKTWSHTYDMGAQPAFASMRQTADGGFIFATSVFRGGERFSDFWLLKLTPGGLIEWQKLFRAGIAFHESPSVRQLADGGYVLAGALLPAPDYSSVDSLLIRLDQHGSVMWQRRLHDATSQFVSVEAFNDVEPTSDGGFMAIGSTASYGNGHDYDAWVARFDPAGNVVWSYRYGGGGDDYFASGVLTADGGIILAGSSVSVELPAGDGWLIKLDAAGVVQWQARYRRARDVGSRFSAIRQLADGNFALVGTNRAVSGSAYSNISVMKVAPDGAILWQKDITAGLLDNEGQSLRETPDGGFFVSAYTHTSSFQSSTWIARFDGAGNVVSQWLYPVTGDQSEVDTTVDGGVVMATTVGNARLLRLDGTGTFELCSAISSVSAVSTDATATSASTSGTTHVFAATAVAVTVTESVASTATATPCGCRGPAYTGKLTLRRDTSSAHYFLDWTAGGGSLYDALRGDLNALQQTSGDFAQALDASPGSPPVCSADNATGLEANADDVVAPNDGSFYLIRNVDPVCLGNGTSDEGAASQIRSRDLGIASSTHTCP